MRDRAAFTTIELAVSMSIIALLAGMALPVISSALRRGTLTSSASIIVETWRKARGLALTHPCPTTSPGVEPRHFGVLIRARGASYEVALVFDAREADAIAADPESAILRSDAEVQDNLAGSPTASEAFRERLSDTVRVVSDPAGLPLAGALVVYAQYRTGLPISAADVRAGRGMLAAPSAVGLPPTMLTNAAVPGINALAPSIAPLLRIQTADYDPARRSGRACAVVIFHGGVTAISEL